MKSRIRKLSLLVGMLCLTEAMSHMVLAQAQSADATSQPTKAGDEASFAIGKLEKTKYKHTPSRVALPDLPDFAGPCKFVDGLENAGDVSGTYIYIYATSESCKAVRDWYSQTLSVNGWSDIKATQQLISARKKSNSVSISLNTGYKPDEKCIFRVCYFLVRK